MRLARNRRVPSSKEPLSCHAGDLSNARGLPTSGARDVARRRSSGPAGGRLSGCGRRAERGVSLRERRFGFAVVPLARVDAIAAEEPASCEVARHAAHGLLENGTHLARRRGSA